MSINTNKPGLTRTHNPLVHGSSPCGPTRITKGLPRGSPFYYLIACFPVLAWVMAIVCHWFWYHKQFAAGGDGDG